MTDGEKIAILTIGTGITAVVLFVVALFWSIGSTEWKRHQNEVFKKKVSEDNCQALKQEKGAIAHKLQASGYSYRAYECYLKFPGGKWVIINNPSFEFRE